MHTVHTPPNRGGTRRLTYASAAASFIALALLALLPSGVGAGGSTSVVECGQLSGYTAPDPVTPADGSVAIGLLTPWVIAADAAVDPDAAAALPSLAGTGPSCLALDLDGGGIVTALDFAPSGSIVGPVIEDTGIPGYILADRLLIPTFVTDAYPELAATVVASAAAGTSLTAAFTIDTTLGTLVGIRLVAEFCGRASLDGDGNGHVGDAVIPAAVLDTRSASRIDAAAGTRRCAEVVTEGLVGQVLELVTGVTITGGPAPTPPDTAAAAASAVTRVSSAWTDMAAGLAVLIGALATLAVMLVFRPRRPTA